MAETMTRSHVGTLYDKGNNPIMHVCQKSPDCDACQRGILYGVEDAASLRHFSIETLQVMLAHYAAVVSDAVAKQTAIMAEMKSRLGDG